MLSFSQGTYRILENGGPASIQVHRYSCIDKSPPVSVNYVVSDGSATGTEDYTDVSGTLSWGASGDCDPKSFSVPIHDDSIFERDETVNLNLINDPSDAPSLGQSAAVLNIIDDDPPMLSFSQGTYRILENGGPASIQVHRSCIGNSPPVSVNYIADDLATAGVSRDYMPAVSGTLSWGATGDGDCGLKSFSVPIPDDSTYEEGKTVSLILSHPNGILAVCRT
ncbi:MAG: hypothetical protein GY862_20455 [Gammaproteobacteria bacterium]|nr:hypothetical protein [Gammaproteobacteria bacterium]